MASPSNAKALYTRDMKASNVLDDISNGVERIPIPVLNTFDHADLKDFLYIKESILGEKARKGAQPIIVGCTCEVTCNADSCFCILDGTPNYNKELKILKKGTSSDTIFECNSCCQCPANCCNRVVQSGATFPMQVYRTDDKGWGVQTLSDIPSYSFVIEYAGEFITEEEAKARNQTRSHNDMNYIFVLREHFGSKEKVTYIDATHKGNVARFLNHSCDPNLFMCPIRVQNSMPHIALFARRTILNGEELTFDYSGVVSMSAIPEDRRQKNEHSIIKRRKVEEQMGGVCLCKASNCKGKLPFDNSLF